MLVPRGVVVPALEVRVRLGLRRTPDLELSLTAAPAGDDAVHEDARVAQQVRGLGRLPEHGQPQAARPGWTLSISDQRMSAPILVSQSAPKPFYCGLHVQLRSLQWQDVPAGHVSDGRAHSRIEKRIVKVVTVAAGLAFPHAAQAPLDAYPFGWRKGTVTVMESGNQWAPPWAGGFPQSVCRYLIAVPMPSRRSCGGKP
jgi:hypothetical protein